MTRGAQRGPNSEVEAAKCGCGRWGGAHVRRAGGRARQGPGAAYLLEVEEGGRAGHGVREHAAGVGQQEAARVRHGAQHGAAGGRPVAEAALRSLRGSHPQRVPLCVRAPCLPGALSVSSSSSSSGPPLPPRLSLRGRHGRKATRLCPVLPCPGGDAGERAREYGKRGYMRERRMRGSGGGSQSLWSHRSPVCKEWCVCECARVRACVAVGGGVPGVLQHQTEPRGGKGIRNDRTTADPTLNPSPAGAGAASPRTLQWPLRCPPPPQSSDCPRVWGLESARRPLLREGAAAPEGAWSRSAFPEAPLLREAGLLVGMSVM